ncbi:SDR family NAD(P)-dependent oxidoreductase [Sphingobium sp. TCM1]|uniref:SDR family NAD(P)-dependent oxidoreductase n=1 Tax=Sphingobium sp. TCM1 TaxID=453246 RepID=UPI0007F51943|nr:SDR family oxidoreductase [Sphingobium sp. TCM1]OAN56265.1 short-chain dehydrogenase [Sphingobium sp. TCM1]
MDMGVAGKIAIVTGGGQGIGRGIVRCLARAGIRLTIAEISEDHGQAAADEINATYPGTAIFQHTDVSDKRQVYDAVARTVAHFGGLDIVINNASALTPNVLLEQKTDDMLGRTMGAGAWGTWWFMHAALPHMQARGGGAFVNFYSIDAEAAAWLHADYNMSKSAILGLSRSAAVEWARYGIRTNIIAPAAAGTVFEALERDNPGFGAMAAAGNPLGRVGDPETDIAPVVLFLVSDMARYVNGETIHADGGQHLPRYDSRPPDLAAITR